MLRSTVFTDDFLKEQPVDISIVCEHYILPVPSRYKSDHHGILTIATSK